LLGSSLTAACILGGNALMVKPSKFTPVTGQLIAELWDRCKLPRGVFNLVQGSGSVIGQRLLGHAALDAVLFHGSYESAREVRRILADRPELPVLYQCGGKGLAIVLEDADIDRAVYEILVGTCLSTGQRHNSTARVLISQRIYTVFVTRLIARLKHIKIGYGFNEDILMGPLISEGFRGRFRKFSAALAARGHQPLYEGQPVEIPGHRGSYVRPSIYEIQWENGHPFLNDEPPGPTLLLYRVKDWEEAAHLHNQAAFRSTTSIFMAHDSPLLPDIRDALKTGAINVNRTTVGSSLRLPSSALGRSGNGLPSGLDLMRLVTWPRASIVEHRPFEATNLVPGIGWEEQEDTETTMEFSVE
jgi:acyl-CoA reductase-like NAD-dependent aldehyde dehydrogenase